MPLRLSCPHCGSGIRLSEPYPVPGEQLHCPTCAQAMAVSYPQGVVERLRERGKAFATSTPSASPAQTRTAPSPIPTPSPTTGTPRAATPEQPRKPQAAAGLDAVLPRATNPAAPAQAAPPTVARSGAKPPPQGAAPPAPQAPAGGMSPTAEGTDASEWARALGPRRSARPGAEPAPPLPTPARPTLITDEDAPTLLFSPPSLGAPRTPATPSPARRPPTSPPVVESLTPPRTSPTVPTPADPPQGPRPSAPKATAPPVPGPPPPAPRREAVKRPVDEPTSPTPVPVPKRAAPPAERLDVAPSVEADRRTSDRKGPPPAWVNPTPPPPAKRRRWPMCLGALGAAAIGVLAVGYGGLRYYGDSLPSVETLRSYRPATVTTVYSKDGKLLGEIYEKRRYVLPLDQIPQVVQNAFIAAEDANFWTHGGIDLTSIARAVWVNVKAGGASQGGSTITQQIAKNFLLTNDKKIERKIKEAILSYRIEDVYTKEHILYLYLNEIFLGSQAYGVEAASRTFFGKHVKDLSLAEAAIIAGLPPRPSDYNPHSHVEMAINRQHYVLDRMVASGFITAAEAEAAKAEELHIVPRNNAFLEETPHFTEYARRYLVDKYGEDLVLNEGLQVYTTCDSKLQEHAQNVITGGIKHMDERLGFRRASIEHLATEAERTARVAADEAALKKAWLAERDPTGRLAVPEKSVLVAGETYPGVVTAVSRSYAKVKVGAHEGIVPVAWSDWIYHPDPEQSFKWRQQDDLTRKYDFTGDGKVDGSILQAGDVLRVKVRALSTKEKAMAPTFRGTPGEKNELLALEIDQTPEIESSLLSFDLATGAVRAMVGGADFEKSQLNRATQAYRQVGSTFKPLVYAAAINAKKVTAATRIPDAELAIEDEITHEVWKPKNYDSRFMGWMTLRKALAQSRNVVTVRLMSGENAVGMNTDVVDKFVRSLGIGGPPTHLLPADWAVSPETDHLCPWVPETADNARRCTTRWPPLPANMTLADHKKELTDSSSYKCRSCDLSMALGSPSLTMAELARAYATLGNGGLWIEPYYIEEVRDRDGKVLEKHDPGTPFQVVPPELSTIMTWMLQGVVESGTAAAANALGLHIAGKTGTTNDEKDVWFVGYTPDVLTTVWVGYDQPRSLGKSATGGAVALPMWMDYMKVAAPKEKDREFPEWGKVEWAAIDEGSGKRTSGWGRKYPFLEGTLPAMIVAKKAGEPVIEDLATEL